MPHRVFVPGASDLESRIGVLEERLVDGLKPLARVAYNYRWSWASDGPAVFRDINPHRWALSDENPVRFLNDLWPATQEAAERDPVLCERIDTLFCAGADGRDVDRFEQRRRGAVVDLDNRETAMNSGIDTEDPHDTPPTTANCARAAVWMCHLVTNEPAMPQR